MVGNNTICFLQTPPDCTQPLCDLGYWLEKMEAATQQTQEAFKVAHTWQNVGLTATRNWKALEEEYSKLLQVCANVRLTSGNAALSIALCPHKACSWLLHTNMMHVLNCTSSTHMHATRHSGL